MGGYARYNSQALRSRLAERFEIRPLRMTVPRFESPLAAKIHMPWRMLVDVLTVTRALLLERPDLLHVTGLYWRSIFREAYAVWLARRLRVPVLYDARAGTFDAFVTAARGPVRRLMTYVLRHACGVALQGREVASRVGERFGVPVVWLPNCFLDRDLAAYPSAPLREPASGEPFRLAFVGYLIPEKGVDVLLEAAERLSRRTPVEVTLIGEVAPRFASTLQAYRSRTSPDFRVEVTGRLDFDEILTRLRGQHVFVFLSRFFGEGQPNAVTEAMAIGLPVVSSRNGFLDDLVGDEGGVRLDDPTDAERVVEELDALRRDWPKLAAMGARARARIVEHFSESVVLDRTARSYLESIARCDGGGR